MTGIDINEIIPEGTTVERVDMNNCWLLTRNNRQIQVTDSFLIERKPGDVFYCTPQEHYSLNCACVKCEGHPIESFWTKDYMKNLIERNLS